MIKPFVLRRCKCDVLGELVPKDQQVIQVRRGGRWLTAHSEDLKISFDNVRQLNLPEVQRRVYNQIISNWELKSKKLTAGKLHISSTSMDTLATHVLCNRSQFAQTAPGADVTGFETGGERDLRLLRFRATSDVSRP
eukprot:749176-Hanusia_phi.AAC.4